MSYLQSYSGQLLDEQFLGSRLNTALWTFWPAQGGRYMIASDRMTILHGEPDAILYLNGNLPDYFMLEMAINHSPTLTSDQAGFIVQDSSGGKLEFLEDVKPGQPPVTVLRLTRHFNLWEGYYQAGGVWHYSGGLVIDEPVSLGVILKGAVGDGMRDLDIERITMSSGAGLRFTGLSDGSTIKLATGVYTLEAMSDGGEAFIDFRGLVQPLQGTLTITSDGITETRNGTFWAGDEFMRELKLEAYFNNSAMSANVVTELGQLYNNELIVEMYIKNNDVDDYNSVHVSPAQVIDQSFDWITLALYDNINEVVDEYSSEIVINNLPAGGKQYFKVKIKRPRDFFAASGKFMEFRLEIGW